LRSRESLGGSESEGVEGREEKEAMKEGEGGEGERECVQVRRPLSSQQNKKSLLLLFSFIISNSLLIAIVLFRTLP